MLSIQVEGDYLLDLQKEAGGHRIQRIPPTEKRGRVHSSTVTVAVINPLEIQKISFNNTDFKIEWYSGTGAGGQHRNKHQNSCRIIHIPSGEIATSQSRSRETSLNEAKLAILEKLNNRFEGKVNAEISSDRKNQVGSGQRGDKVRTYRFQDGNVLDHRSNKRCSINKVLSGYFELLW